MVLWLTVGAISLCATIYIADRQLVVPTAIGAMGLFSKKVFGYNEVI
jgi:hypothetical protein